MSVPALFSLSVIREKMYIYIMHIKYVREINEGKIVCVFKEKKKERK